MLRNDLDYDRLEQEGQTEFRLTYEGILLATGNKSRAVHVLEIRRKFHPQLKRLVGTTSFEGHAGYSDRGVPDWNNRPIDRMDWAYESVLAKKWRIGECGYIPLVTEDLSLACGIDVLFLRYGVPGEIIDNSGDLDGRLKMVGDALRMPKNTTETPGCELPPDGENPFYCLLQDDKLISKITVETDVLLEPTREWSDNDSRSNDSRLVITVRIRPYR